MIHIVIGTKAQLVKMAPIMVQMQEAAIDYNFIFTGQHRGTISEMLDEFAIKPPDMELYTGRDIVSLPQMFFWALRILWSCRKSRGMVFKNDKHGIVLVHGDTFSAILGALMGKVARLKVGHVESGLRSFNLLNPFPEELVRLATFKFSDILFCPGSWAVTNVYKYHAKKILINTEANTLLDTLRLALSSERNKEHVPSQEYAIISLHRFENIFREKTFAELIRILERIARKIHLLFILHPPTEKQLKRFGLYERLENNSSMELRPRYSYFDFVSLLEHASFIVTDGGSIQEESSYLGKPCLLLRRKTERREGMNSNVVLSGMEDGIIDDFVDNHNRWRKKDIIHEASPSKKIIAYIKEYA